jgi:hypothetical protein
MALCSVELFVFAISATIVVRASKARLLQNFSFNFYCCSSIHSDGNVYV